MRRSAPRRPTRLVVAILVLVLASSAAIAYARIAPELVSGVVRAHLPEIRACYEAGLRSRPDLRGRLVVRFTVEADGAVTGAEVASSTLGDGQVEACVLERVRAMQFPPTPRGASIRVSYPFAFEPAPPAEP